MEIFANMPPIIAQVFGIYVGLSDRRSLAALAVAIRSGGSGPGIATLKRWSKRYDWQARIAKHEQEVAQEREAASYRNRIAELNAVWKLKARFHKCVLLDPNDPNLTPAQRRRALNPNVRDFGRLVELEIKLRAQLEPSVPAQPSRLEPCTEEESRAMLDALMRVRHGLPPKWMAEGDHFAQ